MMDGEINDRGFFTGRRTSAPSALVFPPADEASIAPRVGTHVGKVVFDPFCVLEAAMKFTVARDVLAEAVS